MIHRSVPYSYIFLWCHTKLERLIQLRLWPATPISPELVFTFDLMEHVHILILECQVSLHNIAHMLSNLIEKCCVAIPIFHSYAHIASCQHEYSPWNRIGFGLCDGENLERLCSFVGKFCNMTKEMSSSNRIDTLTDALYYYAENKINKLGSYSLLL